MNFGKRRPWYKYLLAGLDWLTLMVSFIIALRLRGRWDPGNPGMMLETYGAEVAFLALFSASALFVYHHFNLYKVNVFITIVDHTLLLGRALAIVVIALALISFFFRTPWILDSRLAILYFIVVVAGLSILVRPLIFRKVFLWLAQNRILTRKVLIVGAGETGKELAVNLSWTNSTGHTVVGFLDDDIPIGQPIFAGARVLGRVGELAEKVLSLGVEEVIICLDTTEHPLLMQVMEEAMGTPAMVKIASPLYDVVPSRLFVEKYGSVPVVGVSRSSPGRASERYKRVFDLILVVPGLILLSPLFLLIGLLIKIDSAGPVI
jgi:FlaA1/EpsC-like NDP-sugar epimerase